MSINTFSGATVVTTESGSSTIQPGMQTQLPMTYEENGDRAAPPAQTSPSPHR